MEACEARGGVARTAELFADGVGRAELAAARSAGRLISPRQGIHVLPTVATEVTHALSHRGMLACVSAARRHGLWTLDAGGDEPTHLWVHPDRHAVEPDDACSSIHHRDRPLQDSSLWIVAIVHCLAQIAWCDGAESFIAALESALRQQKLAVRELDLLRSRIPRPLQWLVSFARSDADSGLESLVRYRLHLLGISVTTQVRIGGVGIVDFIIGDCLILEADGRTHDGPARHADRVRDAAAMTLGFTTLRFDTAMIIHEWDLVESAILAALGRSLHRSPAGLRWDADR